MTPVSTHTKISPAVWALAPMLAMGPALTCGVPRIMAPLFIFSALAAIVADGLQRRQKPVFDLNLGTIFVCLLVFGAASFGWTVYPEGTFSKVGQLAGIFGTLCALVPVIGRFTAVDLKRIGLFTFTGLAFGAGVYLFEMHNGFLFYALTHGPDNHDIMDVKQNKPAVLLGLWLYMSFAFFVPGQSVLKRILFVAMIPVVYLVTFGSKSASAQLIFTAAPMLAIILLILPARISLRLTLLASCFLAVSMPLIAYGVGHHTNWQHSEYLNDSVKSRVEIWDQAARRSMEKPLLGWGLESSRNVPNRGDASYMSGQKIHHLHPHNGLLQIWLELGAVGVFGLCMMFWVFYTRIAAMADAYAQKYAVFMWGSTFLYTLSIWGIWQSWFTATLTLSGVMAYAGARYITLRPQ